MELDEGDGRLLEALQQGLPLTSRPYEALGRRAGMSETEVLRRLERFHAGGWINRMGLIVRHHELGYRANAMMVWALPPERVSEVGRTMARYPFVTLCYRRRPSPPEWPYNLFCMIHGRDREAVLGHRDRLVEELGLHGIPQEVLFSTRRFKQRGAWYLQGGGRRPERPAAAGEA